VGFSVNKNDRATTITAVILSLVGALDSAYLAILKITGSVAACSNFGDCDAVNSSRYAEIGGVPIALLGLLGYLALLGMIIFEIRYPNWKEGLRLAFFGFTLAGVIYSIYLTYIEVAILRAICPFCVISAVVMIGLFIIALYRLRTVTASE
jgi:uncharacterized membrane protein